MFGMDSSNSLSNHAIFGNQNDVICGANGWFTVKKKGELINNAVTLSVDKCVPF